MSDKVQHALAYLGQRHGVMTEDLVERNLWKLQRYVHDPCDVVGIIYHLGHICNVRAGYISEDICMPTTRVRHFMFCSCATPHLLADDVAQLVYKRWRRIYRNPKRVIRIMDILLY